MKALQTEVVIYPPPQDGRPYVVVVIVDDDPQLVGFETTLEQATTTARALHKRLRRTYNLKIS